MTPEAIFLFLATKISFDRSLLEGRKEGKTGRENLEFLLSSKTNGLEGRKNSPVYCLIIKALIFTTERDRIFCPGGKKTKKKKVKFGSARQNVLNRRLMNLNSKKVRSLRERDFHISAARRKKEGRKKKERKKEKRERERERKEERKKNQIKIKLLLLEVFLHSLFFFFTLVFFSFSPLSSHFLSLSLSSFSSFSFSFLSLFLSLPSSPC